MSTVKLNMLKNKLPSQFAFICFASYEERSIKCVTNLDSSSIGECIIFRSIKHNSLPFANEICQHIPQGKLIGLDLDVPISTAQYITAEIEKLYETSKECTSLVIDVTTFTHECLLIALRAIHVQNKQKRVFENIFCVYTSAKSYSSGSETVWLSKGCRDVRNVYGFPGFSKPKNKNALLLLAGYEIERATRLIELLEPDVLVLGRGVNPTHQDNQEDMDAFAKKISEWVESNQERSYLFEFSCRDVKEAYETLKAEITKYKDNYNMIIVPLNTKLSTIATLLIALEEQDVQVCYSVPEFYNEQNYSTPDEYVTLIELNKMGIFSQ